MQDLSFYKLYTYKYLDLAYFLILGSIVYVFLDKKEQVLKSEK